ncbi:MAG: zinc ribbon domain-containing protein [Clostridia bacterium]|nr:zinc ribbon domain-containing protein [Clostridia bacterium]
MFCSKCVAQMPDGANFCGSCGQRVVVQQANLNEPMIVIREPNRVDTTKNESVSDSFGKLKVYVKELAAKIGKEPKLKWGVGIGAAVIVVAVIAIVVYVGYLNTGYKNVLDKYFTVLETADADLYISILPDGWLEEVYYGEDDPKERVESILRYYIVDDSRYSWQSNTSFRGRYGNNYTIDYEIYSVYNPTEEDFVEIRTELARAYGGLVDFDSIEKAVTVKVVVNIKGNGESGVLPYNDPILLVRINGERKLIPIVGNNSDCCFPVAAKI